MAQLSGLSRARGRLKFSELIVSMLPDVSNQLRSLRRQPWLPLETHSSVNVARLPSFDLIFHARENAVDVPVKVSTNIQGLVIRVDAACVGSAVLASQAW